MSKPDPKAIDDMQSGYWHRQADWANKRRRKAEKDLQDMGERVDALESKVKILSLDSKTDEREFTGRLCDIDDRLNELDGRLSELEDE